MDGAFLEIVNFNIILRGWRNSKALQNFLFEYGVLSVVTNRCLDLKCNDFFANSFTRLKIDVDYI